jgi:hypothetical protein
VKSFITLTHGVEHVEDLTLVLDGGQTFEAGLHGAQDHGVDDVHLAAKLESKKTVLNLFRGIFIDRLSPP